MCSLFSRRPLVLAIGLITAASAIQAETQSEIETVVVTGERLQRDIQQTTTSVRVFDEEAIQQFNAESVTDLLQHSANVYADRNIFSIRGIRNSGVTRSDGGSDAITTFVDEVPVTSNNTSRATFAIWDVESVEVLRGAQSTNQGANTLAGAVVVKTARPEFENTGKLKVRAADYNEREIAVAAGGGLIDDVLAYRVALQYLEDDGYLENDVLNDDEWDSNKELNGRVKLLWQPTGDSDTQVLLNVARYDVDTYFSGAWAQVKNGVGDPYDRKNYSNTPWKNHENVNEQAVLEVSHQINDQWGMKWISSYSDYVRDFTFDHDQTDAADAVRRSINEQRAWTQELRFNFENDWLKAVTGLYVSKLNYMTDNITNGNEIDIDGSGPFPAVVLAYHSIYDQTNENYAIYYDSDIQLNDWLTLNVGARYDYTEVEYQGDIVASRANDLSAFDGICNLVYSVTCNQVADGLVAAGNGTGSGDNKDSAFLPKLGLNAQLTDDVNLGFSVQRAFRSAGAGLNIATNEVVAFDPEFSTNYELSLRTQWLDQQLTVNANVFYVDWKDQQVTVTNPNNIYDAYTTNAGESTLQGFELETYWTVSDSINAFATFGFVDTEFNEFVSFNVDHSGNRFPYAAERTASFGLNWQGMSGFFAGFTGRYVDDAFSDIENVRRSDSYTVFDVQGGYQAEDWSLNLYAKNLFDREYITDRRTNVQRGQVFESYLLGAPRVVGVSAEYHW